MKFQFSCKALETTLLQSGKSVSLPQAKVVPCTGPHMSTNAKKPLLAENTLKAGPVAYRGQTCTHWQQ